MAGTGTSLLSRGRRLCSLQVFPLLWTSWFLGTGFIIGAEGYNIDLRTAKVLMGPSDVSFGYSIRSALKLPQTQEAGYMVSATGAQSPTSPGRAPGMVYLCPFSADRAQDCQRFYDNYNDYDNDTYKERFGSSLTLLDSPRSLVVCSPAFRDTSLARQHYHFLPGRCILKTEASGVEGVLQPYRNKFDYTANIPGGKTYKFAYASFGMSADSNEDSVFVVSAPGVLLGEGSLYIRDAKTNETGQTLLQVVDNMKTTAYSYLGYSVKMGKFCNSQDPCVAAGAPGESKVGAVHIFKWDRAERLFEIMKIRGNQSWAFFGASLTAVDFDEDGYDELIVGSPFFTDEDPDQKGKPNTFDQGRVFIFSRTSNRRSTFHLSQTLSGSKRQYARFGYSVQAIGDINLDKVQDIAVGAPWEDEGTGCIYIYFGEGRGVKDQFAQRISPKEFPTTLPKLEGLGFAISKYVKKENEPFPKFSATSMTSNAVVTFTGRTIVDVKIQLYSPAIIGPNNTCQDASIKEPCFPVSFWIEFVTEGFKIYNLDFNITLSIDTSLTTSKRVLFRQPDGSNVDTISIQASRVSHNGNNFTQNALIFMPRVEQNRITPVVILAQYDLIDRHARHPILNLYTPRNVTKSISFQHQCGPNNFCDVDLTTRGFLTYTVKGGKDYNAIIVNGTSELVVNIDVTNSGEISYWTDLSVTMESDLAYLTGPTNCKLQTEIQDNDGKEKVVCSTKVLREGGKFGVALALDTSSIRLDRRFVRIDAQAMPRDLTQSRDKMIRDNSIQLKTEVAIIAKVTLEGSSLPAEVHTNKSRQIPLTQKVDIDESYLKKDLNGDALNVTHRALMKNNGPSLLPKTTILIAVPYFSLDGIQVLQKASVQLTMRDVDPITCEGKFRFGDTNIWTTRATTPASTAPTTSATTARSITTTDPSASTTTEFVVDIVDVNKRRRKKRAAGVDPTIYTMSCKLNPQFCKYFTCVLPTALPPEDYATIDVSMVMEKQNIPIPQDFSAMYYMTTIQVAQPDHFLFRTWNSIPEIQLYTIFHPRKEGETINIWIIVGSVAGGLFLITIITIILWKCGFFKRDKHYQVEKWRQASQRRSQRIPSQRVKSDNGES